MSATAHVRSIKEVFDKLATENYSKCLMTKSYPKNLLNIQNFIDISHDKTDPEDYLNKLAKIVASSITHISFSEFYEHLAMAAREIIKKFDSIQCDPAKKHVIYVIYGDVTKSNFWVSLLVYPLLKKKYPPDELVNDLRHMTNSNLSNDKTYFVIHFDDMSYSGSQIDINLPRQILKEEPPNLSYALLISAISETALARFEPYAKYLYIPPSVLVCKNLNTILDEHKMDPLSNKMERLTYIYWNLREKITPVYFDHKLADSVSTMTKLMRAGVCFNIDADGKVNEGLIGSLIASCSKCDIPPSKYVHDIKNLDQSKCDICPPSFYKDINFTYNNNPIDKNIQLSILLAELLSQ